MEVEHLARARFGVDEETTKRLCKEIDEKVGAYANGDLKYAAEVMSLLWEVSRKSEHLSPGPPRTGGGPIACSQSPLSPRRQSLSSGTPTPKNQEHVKTALIRSIREGVFVDRNYWARHSRSGRVLRPIYLSSIMASHRLPFIDSRKWLCLAPSG